MGEDETTTGRWHHLDAARDEAAAQGARDTHTGEARGRERERRRDAKRRRMCQRERYTPGVGTVCVRREVAVTTVCETNKSLVNKKVCVVGACRGAGGSRARRARGCGTDP